MAIFRDLRGEPTTASGQESVSELEEVVSGYLGARADTRERLDALLAGDPECVFGHCVDGYLLMLSSKRDAIGEARAALLRAQAAADNVGSSRREMLHVAALDAWSSGDMREAAERLDALLAEYPRDIVAIKVSQFVLSYLGESVRMLTTVERVLSVWDASVPGYGFVLGCHAYALEEAGEYTPAEAVGRQAVELNPSDIWAAHAVAHVQEMEGRLREGIDWISAYAEHWQLCNNFAFHLRWHEGLYHLELERHAHVLQLYDKEVRAQSTDEYLDVSNAVSLLWRLEQAEVDVGARWQELAQCANGHIDDHALVFADLHYFMALAAANDTAAIERFMESGNRFAQTVQGTEAGVMRDVGLPLARAILGHRRGSYGDVVDMLSPIRKQIRRIGGSHAQRDVFDQLYIDAAWRGGKLDLASRLLAERTAQRPRNLWGWKHYAAVLDALGSPRAAEANRELERLRAL
jgi:tetratricopeptide (TPR) repeat protein